MAGDDIAKRIEIKFSTYIAKIKVSSSYKEGEERV